MICVEMVFRRSIILSLASFFSGCKNQLGSEDSSGVDAGEDAETKLIDDDGRKYLWDIEHRVNFLTKSGFPLMENGISNNDRVALTALFPPNYLGALLPKQKVVSSFNRKASPSTWPNWRNRPRAGRVLGKRCL